jgi:hypothetical protein
VALDFFPLATIFIQHKLTASSSDIPQFSLNKAEDLISRGPLHYPEALHILQEAIRQDPANLDAVLLAVGVLEDKEIILELLKRSEKVGKRKLLEVMGPKAFDDDGNHVG